MYGEQLEAIESTINEAGVNSDNYVRKPWNEVLVTIFACWFSKLSKKFKI